MSRSQSILARAAVRRERKRVPRYVASGLLLSKPAGLMTLLSFCSGGFLD